MRHHVPSGGPPALALALALLGGCAATPAPDPVIVVGDTSPSGAAAAGAAGAARAASAARIGTADAGVRVELPAGAVPGHAAVLVGEPYAAASGRDCRRLLGLDGRPLARVVCAHPGGWRFVRSLAPPSAASVPPLGRARIAPDATAPALAPTVPAVSTGTYGASLAIEPLPPSAVAASDPSAGPHDAREHALRDGETLWSFAARVTGEGRHWSEIAALNGIDDATRLGGARRLLVPAALARE